MESLSDSPFFWLNWAISVYAMSGGKDMDTLWNRKTDFNKYESLTEDVCVDTIVIGAGIAGLMTAYFLRDKGGQVAVLEADRIVSGQTAGTTAKITSQHNMIYQRLIRSYGIERARMYAGWNEWAINAYEKIIEDKKIECNQKSGTV